MVANAREPARPSFSSRLLVPSASHSEYSRICSALPYARELFHSVPEDRSRPAGSSLPVPLTAHLQAARRPSPGCPESCSPRLLLAWLGARLPRRARGGGRTAAARARGCTRHWEAVLLPRSRAYRRQAATPVLRPHASRWRGERGEGRRYQAGRRPRCFVPSARDARRLF